jgi:hypothetical protein
MPTDATVDATAPNATPYDSGPDTIEHIRQVAERLTKVCVELRDRADFHDASKLGPIEKPTFDATTPKLKGLTYGSPEYRAALKELGPALDNHYQENSHHPEWESMHEEWRDVVGYEDFYQVSSLGRVRSVARVVDRQGPTGPALYVNEMMRKAHTTPKGYQRIQLRKESKPRNHLVHVLVAEAFIGPRPTEAHEVNHKDGFKSNNRHGNLEWATPSENQKHAYETGLKESAVAKYVFVSEELGLAGLGPEKMAAQCHKMGHPDVTAAGIWGSAMRGYDHAGLSFSAFLLVGEMPYSGIAGMDLLDLIEMYCDWAAATLRHKTGDLGKSIEHNAQRFGMSDTLASVFRNTFVRHGGFRGYQDSYLWGQHPNPEDPAWTRITDVGTCTDYARRPMPNTPFPRDEDPNQEAA